MEINPMMWELYKASCKRDNVTPSVRDFAVWMEEKYPELIDNAGSGGN